MNGVVSRDDAIEAIISAIKEIKAEGEDIQIDASSRLYSSEGDGCLELDSLDGLELITALEEQFDLEVLEEIDLEQITTVGDVADLLVQMVATSR